MPCIGCIKVAIINWLRYWRNGGVVKELQEALDENTKARKENTEAYNRFSQALEEASGLFKEAR